MEYNLGNFNVALSGWGKSKKKMAVGFDMFKGGEYNCLENDTENIPKNLITSGNPIPKIWMYGQDSFGVLKDENILVIANADGHGGTFPEYKEGIDFAYYATLFCITEIVKHISYIKIIYKNKTELDGFMNDIIQKLDNFLLYDFPDTCDHKTAGATLTLNIKFLHKRKLVSIVTNTGDSLFVRINRENRETTENTGIQVLEESKSFNCDTLDSYRLYVTKCNENNIVPKEIYLGRFNMPTKCRISWVHTKDKNPYKPIIPFKLIHNKQIGKYGAEENIEQMEKLYNNAPTKFKVNYLMKGGTQSIRDIDLNKTLINEGKYPATNFGNTIEGSCQCLPGCSIGDKDQKNNQKNIMISNTSVNIYGDNDNINNTGEEIIGSDGFFDAMPDKNIIENMVGGIETKKENLKNTMIKNAKEYSWGDRWDDISFCVIQITKTKNGDSKNSKGEKSAKNKKNKFKTKRDNRRRRNKLKRK